MHTSYEKPIYQITEYHGKHPCFHDTSKYPWVAEIESQWEVIRDELMDYIDKHGGLRVLNSALISEKRKWKCIYLSNFSWITKKNLKHFPKTVKILSALPNMVFGVFSVLEPHSTLVPHYGDTNTTLRSMLGLQIPGKLPELGIKVGKEEKGWEEGKIVMFTESHLHTAWNNTDERRILLIFDVLPEEYLPEKHIICSRVLAGQVLRHLYWRFPFTAKLPSFLDRILYWSLTALWYVYLPFQSSKKL